MSKVYLVIIVAFSISTLASYRSYPYVASYFLLSSASYHLEQYAQDTSQDQDILVRAIHDLESARSLNPQEVLTYLRLSQAYLYLQRPRDAINILKTASYIEPNSLLIKRELIRVALIANDIDLAVQLLRDFSDYQIVSIIADLIYYFQNVNPNTLRSVLENLKVDLDAVSDNLEVSIGQSIRRNGWQEALLWLQALSVLYDGKVEQFDKIMFRLIIAKLVLGLSLSSAENAWIDTSNGFVHRFGNQEKLELTGEHLRWLTEVRKWNVFAGDLVRRRGIMHWSGKAGFIVSLKSTGCYQLRIELRKIGDPLSIFNVYVNNEIYPFSIDISEGTSTKVFFVDLQQEINTIVIDFILDNGDLVVERITMEKDTRCKG